MNFVSNIQTGEVGVIPTDTIYGIVGSALSPKIVERIYTLKGRDEHKPFIILIGKEEQLSLFSITERNISYWKEERPTSVIFKIVDEKWQYLHRGTNSLAFRFPQNKELQEFLKETGPLVAPSANPQGEEPASTIDEAKEYFADTVDFYIDGGVKEGTPSRIISLVDGEKIIRP